MSPVEEGPRPPARVGNYRIEERLGAGGMGAVYRAFDEVLRRPLALKHLLPGRADDTTRLRFRREAQAAARLNHPAIVHIYDIVETAEGDWIVMELVEGRSLDRLIAAGELDVLQALRLGREIAEGLGEAHAHGIVHRDLKANNVMVTGFGRAKILDFGIAKLPAEPGEAEISQAGLILGTWHAMSPEQAMGLPVDHRSDLFSLGSLLYEMLTGTSPFRTANTTETLARICSYQPPPVGRVRPDVPAEVSGLVEGLLRKSPEQRPGNAAGVAAALEAAADRLRMSRVAPLPFAPPADAPAPGDSSVLATFVEGPPSGTGSGTAATQRRPVRERRQVTLACCELTGVRTDGGRTVPAALDPEALSDLFPEVKAMAGRIAGRFGGAAGDTLGHLLTLHFGYPQAHEDAARRAVSAALELADEVERLSALALRAGEPRLALRAGVHTGTAVVLPEPETLTLGSTLDAASGILGLAGPGEVLVSAATERLLKDAFGTAALPPVEIAATGESLAVFRILPADTATDSTTRGRPVPAAPLVGRGQELGLLLDLWQRAAGGHGQVVLISGEAGIGKSHLVRTLRERIGDGALWLLCGGSPYGRSSPLQPVVEMLGRLLQAEEGATAIDRLEALLRPTGLPLDEAVPLFASLLGLPPHERHPPPALSPDQARGKTLELLAELVLGLAEVRPLVWAVEDLHWLDPSTLQLLDLLLEQAATAPVCLVLTVRPQGTDAPWAPRVHVNQLHLAPLAAGEVERLIDQVAADRPLPAPVRRQIVARTDGVPLFVEELTKAVLESGPLHDPSQIPGTLRDSLAARLDRLGTAKEVAQLASVLGRSFTFELLAAVAGTADAVLQRELRSLVRAELLQRRGAGPRPQYLFKHALICDAAYDSLPRRERQQIHLRIAEALVTVLPGVARSQPELLAHHYTEAGSTEPAVAAWLQAGQQSLARSANLEAIQQLERGLELLAGLPAGPKRARWEFDLLTTLGSALLVTRGFAAPEVKETYTRAQELIRQLQDEPEPRVLWGLFTHASVQGDYAKSLELGRQILRIAGRRAEPTWLLAGHVAMGVSHFYRGEIAEARGHFEHARTSEPLPPAGVVALGTRGDLVMIAIDALALWLLGHPRQALQRCQEVILQARIASHPYTLTAILLLTGYVYFFCRDAETVRREADEILAVTAEHGLYMTREGNILLGWARASDGDGGGIDLLRDHLAQNRALGFRVWETLYSCMLISACLDYGRLDEADRALDQAFAAPQERFLDAELHRLRGEAALAHGDEKEAESRFLQALERARAAPLRSLELRAALSLARLWQAQRREREAGGLLAGVYGAFAEGLDTPDLVEARALLSDFARHSR